METVDHSVLARSMLGVCDLVLPTQLQASLVPRLGLPLRHYTKQSCRSRPSPGTTAAGPPSAWASGAEQSWAELYERPWQPAFKQMTHDYGPAANV